MKSKKELLNKYLLGPKKKGQKKKEDSRVLDAADDEIEKYDQKSQSEEDGSDELPVFVETEESRKIHPDDKKRAMELLTAKNAKPKATGAVLSSSGKWLEEEKEIGALGKRAEREVAEVGKRDSEEDSSSSESKQPRKRHDSSDSDMEIDSQELKLERTEREKAFKNQLATALGVEPRDSEESDSDISVKSDAKEANNNQDAADELLYKVTNNKAKLEEIKKKERMMNELAEQYKNATTVIRGVDGQAIDIKDMKESKEARLKELNEKNVSVSKISCDNGEAG